MNEGKVNDCPLAKVFGMAVAMLEAVEQGSAGTISLSAKFKESRELPQELADELHRHTCLVLAVGEEPSASGVAIIVDQYVARLIAASRAGGERLRAQLGGLRLSS